MDAMTIDRKNARHSEHAAERVGRMVQHSGYTECDMIGATIPKLQHLCMIQFSPLGMRMSF